MGALETGDVTVDFRLAVDTGGFVRRECPRCGRHFKVAARGEQGVVLASVARLVPHENAAELPDARLCWCAYCGHSAPGGEFLTSAQRVYLEACARRLDALLQVEQLRVLDPVDLLAISVEEAPEPCRPPEPDDLCAVPLWCCGERLKLKPGWREGFFCPRCGARQGET